MAHSARPQQIALIEFFIGTSLKVWRVTMLCDLLSHARIRVGDTRDDTVAT
jgi:hypothetical protein